MQLFGFAGAEMR